MSGAQDSSWREYRARVGGGGCGQTHILGTDSDSGTTGALDSADTPWFQKQGKKELSAEGNLLPFLPEVLTV